MAHSWTKKCTELELNYHFCDIIEMLATLLAEYSMKAEDFENYLSQLGQELLKRGIQEPIHLLLIGGAYMLLLTNTARNTDDIDIFWLENDGAEL
jgi:hypothetical protein